MSDTKGCACGHPSCVTAVYLAAQREREQRQTEEVDAA